MRHIGMRRLLLTVVLALLLLTVPASAALAADPDVTVTTGPTAITNGSCLGANDLTIDNGYFAIAIAVDTTPPWGVPNGSILDGTTITNGVWGRDKLTLVDNLPNAWAAWPNTYQNIAVTTNTVDQAVVTIERDYMAMELVTTITVDKGSRFVKLQTVATNPSGSGATYTDLYPGYTFCTSGGFMFGPYGKTAGVDYDSVTEDYGKYVLGYDSDYSIGMHYPDADSYDGGTGWKDLYKQSTFAPGDTATLDAVVQFEDSASISRFVATVIEARADLFGTVSGSVTPASGDFPEPAIVVVEKDGAPFTWVVAEGGAYALDLPVGDYQLYAVAKGYSTTDKVDVSVTDGGALTQDFAGLITQSAVTVNVANAYTNLPNDARIKVTGGTPPLVGFLGKSVFFTELDEVGTATFNVAPGNFALQVAAGNGFTTWGANVPLTVAAGTDQTVKVKVMRVFNPAASRWYSADMHHHSNILDGVTPPEYVVRSQLAAGLDFTSLSDHDSFDNNQAASDLSTARGVPFISSDEISPIWAHFNVLAVSLTKPVTIDPSGTAKEIIDAAHEAGMLITLNHPYIAYGYFTAADNDAIPGGYYPNFDFIELQSTNVTDAGTSPDERTLARAMSLWTSSLKGENRRYYVVSGTDTHDVWSWISGTTRTYAKIPAPQKKNQTNYIKALKAGRSYVTQGPLVEPLDGKMFGKTVKVRKSRPRMPIRLRLKAVDGLKSVTMLRNGKVAGTRKLDGSISSVVKFRPKNTAKAWYAFIVEDLDGSRAITNPIWTRMVR